jgi:hypothetical protein
MDRRELLKMIGLVTGAAVIGGDMILTGCSTETKDQANRFTQNDVDLLDEVAETIIPRTATPGAKDAAVGMFMTVMVNDCYKERDQQVFFEGMRQLNESAKEKFGGDFIDLAQEKREELLRLMENEARVHQENVDVFNDGQREKERQEFESGNLNFERDYMSSHYYIMMKQLTLLGFFTSEVGSTMALRHVTIPGHYEGCIPYKKGDRAWG